MAAAAAADVGLEAEATQDPAGLADAPELQQVERQLSELSQTTVDAGGPLPEETMPEEAVLDEGEATAPASPAAPPPVRSVETDHLVQKAAESLHAWQTMATVDALSMSSTVQMRPTQSLDETTAVVPMAVQRDAQQLDSKAEVEVSVFPAALGSTLNKKLQSVRGAVAELKESIRSATSVAAGEGQDGVREDGLSIMDMHKLLETAKELQDRVLLSDEALEPLDWPTKELQEMRAVVAALEAWDRSQALANATISSGMRPLERVVETLAQLLAAWSTMYALSRRGELKVDLGLAGKARGVQPTGPILVEGAMAAVRQSPMAPGVRKLEILLQSSYGKEELEELGIAAAMTAALKELTGIVHEERRRLKAADREVVAPEPLWRAVTEGNVAAVNGMIRQGALASGLVQDGKGHSVFWDAIAFNATEVAFLLLQCFPPDSIHGVDLSEVHPRNGNSLLHLLSSSPGFTQRAAELFSMVFELTPADTRRHLNARGQTFVHVAAGNLNFWILRYAAFHSLDTLFSIVDQGGWSVRKLLAQHLDNRHIVGSPPPLPPSVSGAVGFPSWFSLGAMFAGTAGQRPPFADLVIEVFDEMSGVVELYAHRAILACNGVVLKDHMLQKGSTADKRIQISAECCRSSMVVLFALQFLYTGSFECSFRDRAGPLLQLLQLGHQLQLPSPLLDWTRCAILECLKQDASNGDYVPLLLCKAEEFGFSPTACAYLGGCLLRLDAAWQNLEKQPAALAHSLRYLEPIVLGIQQ